MVSEMIVSQYYSFAIMSLIVSILGAITVAALDGMHSDMGRTVPQH
jgi:hypothetical protein